MVPESVRHFIGGQDARSALGKSYGVASPATGKDYAQVEVGTPGDITQAVLAAQAALTAGPWPAMTAAERAGALHALADAAEARLGDLVAADALGAGLPLAEALDQSERAVDAFRHAALLLAGSGTPGGFTAGNALLTTPAGVAGLVTSWRTPFLAQARAVAPALAAGCTVVLKPDERAPLAAARLIEIAVAAGLPDGVLNIVHGSLHRKASGDEARDALIAHPGVARVSFAGEHGATRAVMVTAAAHGKVLAAEPAGPAPALIFADADLDAAADAVLLGAFGLGGQRRTATAVVLVQQPVYDEVVARLAAGADRIAAGDPADPATRLGPLPHPGHYDALTSAVRRGVRDGARLAAGGRRPAGLPEGSYLAATVLADVTPAMADFTEPTRGPLLRIAPFGTEEEAASLAAAVADPSAAYLWTADPDRARSLAARITAADIWVNCANAADRLTTAADSIGFYTRSQTVRTSEENCK